jgi:hypothetical protein
MLVEFVTIVYPDQENVMILIQKVENYLMIEKLYPNIEAFEWSIGNRCAATFTTSRKDKFD